MNVDKNSGLFNKKEMLLFSCSCSFIAISLFLVFLDTANVYRLVFVGLIFFFVCYKNQKIYKNLVINYNSTQDMWYALTAAIILVLAVDSFNLISHMLFHTSFVLTGIYDAVKSVDIFYQLYKTAIMFLDVFFIFLVCKFRFIKMKDVKNMSLHKRIPIMFCFCLLSVIYLECVYDSLPPSIAQYRNSLLWSMGLILPSYMAFYLTTTYLTKLLNLRSNSTADASIHIWLFNPAMFNTTSLSVYDSDVFTANFESKKLAIKRRLDKLNVNDECKGYSELIFCLFLTRLFIGLKGWSFKTDIFLQASLVIDMPAPKVRKNIEDIIEQVWSTSEAETLIDGYYFPYYNSKIYDQMERPKVEEFLMSIAKSI